MNNNSDEKIVKVGETYTDEELCELINAGDTSKTGALIESCRRTVLDIVKELSKNKKYWNVKGGGSDKEYDDEYYPTGFDKDLVSVGYKAVLEAVEKYEPGKGATFKTYAHKRIMGEVLKEIIHLKIHKAYIPSEYRDLYYSYNREFNKLYDSGCGYQEIIVKMSKHFGTSVNKIEEVLGVKNYSALDAPYDNSEGDQTTLGDAVCDANSKLEEFEKAYMREEDAMILRELIEDLLKPDEEEVFNSYYGLNGYEKKTIEQIARENGRSEKTISNIKSSAEKKIKEVLLEMSKGGDPHNWLTFGLIIRR